MDLLEGIIVNLRSRHVPSVALGHDSNLFFLAIGRGDRAVFGDLEIALALDARGGWLRRGSRQQHYANETREADSMASAHGRLLRDGRRAVTRPGLLKA
jgi:hypothetical protein